jgi:glycosyltransferase involved in cell wall biosynthesis
MYNRERFIARAIDSCLKQDFEDFEIIVVDDGSTDNSIDVVKQYIDPRIRLLCHEVNRGVGPARNTGVDNANGEWVVYLDSDDELLPGSLATIYGRSIQLDESISRMQFMGQLDTGEISPDPLLKNEFWDYIAYIKWMENCFGHFQDTLPIIRRETFKEIRFYNDKTLEGPYHLDFMKRFNAWSFPDVVALYHQDAENQLTKPNVNRTIENAKYQALSGELMLKNHGETLKAYAPKIYRRQVSGLATLWFLSYNRLKGIEYSFFSIASNFFSVRNWVILIFGLVGAKPLAYLKSFRASIYK